MKNKFSKILGVGLTIALLASLMVVAAPISASSLSWGAEKDPSHSDYENLVVSGISITDLAASGDVIYASTNTTSTPLYKSTDGGATWTSLVNSTSFPSGVSVKAIAVAPDDADVVAIITSANEVEYSTNGGSSWTDLNKPSDTSPAVTADTLSAIDIAPGTTRYLAVGGDTTGSAAELFTIKLTMAETWQARMSGAAGIMAAQTDIKAVKFSPSYATDKAITVISGTATTANFQLFRYESGDYDWNGQIDYLPAAGDGSWGTGIEIYDNIIGSVGAADIELPSDYLANDEGYRLAMVAVAGATSGGGVTRLTDTQTADFDLWNDGAPGGVGSIAYSEAGKLVCGDYDNNQVYCWATPLSGASPNAARVNTLKQPGGTSLTVVTMSGDTVVAGTSGDESAIAVSTDDGYSFNDVGLIDTAISVIDDFAINADGSKIYLTTHDTDNASGNYDTSVWVKDSSWKRVYSSIDIADANAPFLVRIAPDDDTAIYISSKGTNDIWRSKDSGMETWKHVPCYKVTAVQDFVLESADVVYALDTAAGSGVSKTTNAGASWGDTKEPTESIDGYMVTLAPNGDILVGDINGYVAFSKDGGSTFDRTKDFGSGNAIVVADDDYADNNIIYVGIGTAVKRSTATTTATPGTRGTTTSTVTGMAVVEDVTYALCANATESRLWQSLKMETAGSTALAEWSSVLAAGKTYLSTPQALKLSLSGTSPKLWAIDTTSPALESYTDAIALVGPTLVKPADGANIAVNPGTGRSYDITFIWERYSDSDIDEMQMQIATDSGFDAIIYDETFTSITTDTIAKVIGPTGQSTPVSKEAEFMPGETYYWRVRTGLNGPMYSPWSEVRAFTVGSIDAFAISGPTVGASSVSLTPTFTWSAYPDAIGYEIAVSEDTTFTILEWSYNVSKDTTFYQTKPGDAFLNSTTYYWRVRGVTGEAPATGAAPGGPWATGVFTTMAVEEEEEPIVITEQEPGKVTVIEVPVQGPAQAIPNWMLLTIIAIGAVLLIALIVLIVRTRRVA